MVHKILVVNMNYMGDALLTTPALSALREKYPDAQIDTIVGAGASAEVLRGNPDLNAVISREASGSLARIGELYRLLRHERYSEVIILPPLPAYAIAATLARTPARIGQADRGMNWLLTRKMRTQAVHMADAMLDTMPVAPEARLHRQLSVALSEQDRADAASLLNEEQRQPDRPLVAVNLGATRPQKRWLAEHFAGLIDLLEGITCVLIGAGDDDERLASRVLGLSKSPLTVNLVGRTEIKQLAALLERCDVLLTSDSGSMHLATAVGTPCVALFGSTDPAVTGPYDQRSRVLYKNLACAPCFSHPTCSGRFDCMREITPFEAAVAVRDLLRNERATGASLATVSARKAAPRTQRAPSRQFGKATPRILIVTKFRFIGDTLVAIPIFRAARARWPDARLTLLTGRNARVLLQNNPYLDEIIEFDPNQRDCGLKPFARLIGRLRRDRFDYGLTLNRSFHSAVIPWLAGIKVRAGFCSEGRSFLLNRRVPYEYNGDQSEVACYFDVLRAVAPDIPVQPALELWVTPDESRRAERQLAAAFHEEPPFDCLIGIQPGASLPEKRWPVERFAEIAEAIAESMLRARIVLLGGPDERVVGDALWALLSPKARSITADFIGNLDLRGSLAQVSGLSLFLGNDTAIMHSAVALGVPTIALFGPTNPRKWGNYGDGHRVLESPDGAMASIPAGDVLEALRSLCAGRAHSAGIISVS